MKDQPSYWNQFYANTSMGNELIPSQFAAFVASEYADYKLILEFGCGAGRDSLFFASLGKKVVGLDASESAISKCNQRKSSAGIDADFFRFDVGLPDRDLVAELKSRFQDMPKILYARFFLHAIDEHAQDQFLQICDSLIYSADLLALEFRTHLDSMQQKITSAHYRRYINPDHFLKLLYERGYDIQYSVQGFGFAKFKQDDAHVARLVLKK